MLLVAGVCRKTTKLGDRGGVPVRRPLFERLLSITPRDRAGRLNAVFSTEISSVSRRASARTCDSHVAEAVRAAAGTSGLPLLRCRIRKDKSAVWPRQARYGGKGATRSSNGFPWNGSLGRNDSCFARGVAR